MTVKEVDAEDSASDITELIDLLIKLNQDVSLDGTDQIEKKDMYVYDKDGNKVIL